jgi:hypothetical protein
MAITHIPIGLMFLGYLPLCITRSSDFSAFLLLIGVSIVQSAFTGARTVFDYKIPYYIYTPADYADINAVSGALSSVISFAVGALLSYLPSIVDYVSLMLAGFTVSAAFVLVAGALHLLMRSVIVPEGKEETETRVSLISIFKQPIFLHLLFPNITRGFAAGATTVVAVAALSRGYGESVTSALVSAESVSVFVAGFLFIVIARRLSSRWAILVGSLLFSAMPLLLVRGNEPALLIAYALVMLGRNVVDNAVPSALIFVVPIEMAGQYNALRMVLHNGGMLIATATAVFIPTEMLFVAAMIAQLASGVAFFFLPIMRKSKNI